VRFHLNVFVSWRYFPIHLILETAVSQLILKVYSRRFEISWNDVDLYGLESCSEPYRLTFIIISLRALHCLDSLNTRWVLVDLNLLQIDESVFFQALKFHSTLRMFLLHPKHNLIIVLICYIQSVNLVINNLVHMYILLLHLWVRVNKRWRILFERRCRSYFQFTLRIRQTFQPLRAWRSIVLIRRRWVRIYRTLNLLLWSFKHLSQLHFWDI
jgi:hypothetical protein